MKTSVTLILLSISASTAFLCSYFFDLTMGNIEQFLSTAVVILVDGFFGLIAGIKREGFKTYKAIKVLRSWAVWWVILGALLTIEKGFEGTSWLSETIIVPFLVFELISAIKNASMAGFIKADVVNAILDKIDKHKGERK